VKWVKWIAGSVAVLVLAVFLWVRAVSEPLPDGAQGQQADELVRKMDRSLACEGWDVTGVVAWTFRGKHHHLWDRKRQLLRTDAGSLRVYLDLTSREGRAFEDGNELEGAKLDRALEKAWSWYINDSFWLNPFCAMLGEGMQRSILSEREFLVTYPSGGVTPGDSYAIRLDEQYRPEAWRMWVSILPIGGLEASWEGWKRLPTGAWISERHAIGPLSLELEVRGAASVEVLFPEEMDPFGPLLP